MQDQEITRLLQEQEAARQKQADDAQREMQLMMLTQPKQQQQQSGSPMGGMNPMSMMGGGSGGGLFGGGSTGVTAGTSAAHTGGAMGASGGGSSAAGGGASAYSGLASFWPAAVVAAAIANEKYQKNTGNRNDESFMFEDGLKGTAFKKDMYRYGDDLNKKLPGAGNDWKLAGDLSSPTEMFKGSTYSDIWKNLKSGGLLGGLVRKAF